MRRFLALGMLPKLVVSSDAGPFDIEFGKLWQGLEVAVRGRHVHDAGAPGEHAHGRRGLRRARQAGTLEPGKEADVLVVEANPLDRISNLRDVVAVFKAGERVVGE